MHTRFPEYHNYRRIFQTYPRMYKTIPECKKYSKMYKGIPECRKVSQNVENDPRPRINVSHDVRCFILFETEA